MYASSEVFTVPRGAFPFAAGATRPSQSPKSLPILRKKGVEPKGWRWVSTGRFPLHLPRLAVRVRIVHSSTEPSVVEEAPSVCCSTALGGIVC